MYYCETSDSRVYFLNGLICRIKSALRRRAGWCMTLLTAFVTPESSILRYLADAERDIGWFGAAKTVFWLGNAIMTGIVLANTCN